MKPRKNQKPVPTSHDPSGDGPSRVRVSDGEGETLAALGYTEAFQYVRLCRTCYHLFEVGRPDGLNQACACHPGAAATWPRFDFNERAHLCSCCALTVLESGSRWSPFFCRQCHWLAVGVTMWHRQLVFPIGRHSLMHTWVPNTRTPPLAGHGGDVDALARSVYEAGVAVINGGDRLHQWAPLIVRRNVERLGLRGDVHLLEYLLATVRQQFSPRLEAFGDLCEFVRALTPAPRSQQ